MKTMKEKMMRLVKRIGLPAIALMVVAVFGIPLTTYAISSKSANAAVAQGQKLENDSEEPDNEQNDAEEPDDEQENDAEEAAALAGKAELTEAQAKNFALAANPDATVQEAELGDENGIVIYEIKMADANGKSFEVNVDATNGSVLSADDKDENEND